MKFLNAISLNEAKEIVKVNLPSSVTTEVLSYLDTTQFKIASRDVAAPFCMPPFDRSTVDGYAVKASETFGASESIPALLKIVKAIKIGEEANFTLNFGEAAQIATGAAMPEGADSVVMIENTKKLGDTVAVFKPLKVRENVVKAGEDLRQGDIVLSRGEILNPLKLGALAGLGVSQISIFKTLNVAVISSGDELVQKCANLPKGKINDQNSTIIPSLCQQSGFNVNYTELIKDNLDDLKNAIKKASDCADIVIVTGGSSVGEHDFTAEAISQLGQLIFAGIKLKPGKPTMFGSVGKAAVFGLAGNPLAAALSFKLLIEDTIKELRCGKKTPLCYAVSAENFPSTAGRTTIALVKLNYNGNSVLAEFIPTKTAYFCNLLKADGYIVLEENCEGIYKGELLKVYPI